MATPTTHKQVVAVVKVVSSTVLDLLCDPKRITDAWGPPKEVQLKEFRIFPFIDADTKPAQGHYGKIQV